MPRFFIDSVFEQETPKLILLKGDNAFHLVRVLRARKGEEVTVVTGDSREYVCRFVSADDSKNLVAELEVLFVKPIQEKPCKVTLIQGMPKGKKVDFILQKSTELGADRIFFVYTERSIPVSDGRDEAKVERFRRICEEAAAQSCRNSVPEIGILKSFSEAIKVMKDNDVFFSCYEGEQEHMLPEVLESSAKSIAFLIGPEGGLSFNEVEQLKNADIPSVSLGQRILRTETAPLAVLSIITYETEMRK